jgi:hypothetical protein
MIFEIDAATLTRLLRSRPLPSRERWSAGGSRITTPLVGEIAPKGRVRGETSRSQNSRALKRLHVKGGAA